MNLRLDDDEAANLRRAAAKARMSMQQPLGGGRSLRHGGTAAPRGSPRSGPRVIVLDSSACGEALLRMPEDPLRERPAGVDVVHGSICHS